MSIDLMLDRPASEGARVRALELLGRVRAERARLDAPDDGEAVHDFRVALRRLRSWLRSLAPHLGKKASRLRRRLGDVADATASARDAEVQLDWLAAARARRPAAPRPAFDWLGARLEDAKARGYVAVRTSAARDFDARLARADRRLARYRRDLVAESVGPTLAAALAALVREHFAELAGKLGAIAAPEDETTAHAARILAKQLRYLVEPLADSDRLAAPARAAVRGLKGLQDLLGELHDAHVLGHVVAEAVAEAVAAPAPPDVRVGLHGLARRVRSTRDARYRALRATALVDLTAQIDALAAGLAGPPAGVEIERKYLLSAMPAVGAAEALQIEQGYLPGQRLVERLRRSRAADGAERLVRSMKLGTGIRRIEVEEECPPELFAKLWPLTAGRRIAKTRFKIRDGERTWEIDRFADRDLVLAEVELPSETTPVAPPAWLAGAVVREVTGEKVYTNEALATSAGERSGYTAAAPSTSRTSASPPRRRRRRR
jgi:CHAD domain-containing protein/CYTH domain-containing protein